MARTPALPCLALALLVMASTMGCEDTANSPTEGGTGAGQDSGQGGPDARAADAGPYFALPDASSQVCQDARDATFVTAAEADCWSQAAPQSDDHCFGFYCNWSHDQLACAVTSPNTCGGELGQRLGCDGTLQTVVSACAREAATDVVTGQLQDGQFAQATLACTKSKIDDMPMVEGEVGDPCLDCYVQSASCARAHCTMPCLNGDTRSCDDCREQNGCTPDFYACVGSPNPLLLNPNMSTRE